MNIKTEGLWAYRQKLFYYIPVLQGMGILTYFFLSFEPPLLLSAVFFLFFCAFLAFKKEKIKNSASIYFFIWGVFFYFLGFFCIHFKTTYVNTYFLKTIEKNLTIEGTLCDIEEGAENHRYTFSNLKGTPLKKVRLKGKLEAESILPGNRYRCEVTLLPLSAPVSPVAYDFRRGLYYAQIGASGRIHHCDLLNDEGSSLSRMRYLLNQKLNHLLQNPYNHIAKALVTGDRSGISNELRQRFTDAGLAHILAISGLHLSLVSALIFLCVRRGLALSVNACLYWPLKTISAIISIFATALYLALAGFPFPAQRAFFMTTFVMLGICLNRRPISLRSVALAAFLILLFFPESIVSVSFQLSFAAVIALVSAYEFLTPLYHQSRFKKWYLKPFVYVLGVILTTFIATIATTPLSMATFNRFTLNAIWGNLLAIPLTAFWIMPLGVASMISLLWGGSSILFYLWEQGIKLLINIATQVALLPGSAILVPTPNIWFYVLFCLGGLFLCLGPFKILRFTGSISVLLSLLTFSRNHHPLAFFASDRSVFAYLEDDNFYVSSLTRGKFYVNQWCQHLGIHPHSIKLMPHQSIKWKKFILLADPFKNPIDHFSFYGDKKKFIKGFKQDSSSLLTNSYLKNALLDGERLEQEGSYFVMPNLTLKKLEFTPRPWVF